MIFTVIMSKKIFLKVWSDKSYFKVFAYMEKKTSKVIVEVVKAILYALLGLLGGNAVM